ncbi:hypothetical protein CDAR_13681 [Caerostris darwini]|uniref:Uncharacterized protein n=1 Tax=Caerostris darwini TaxID=1538125 RepID=A0AAV4U7R2_9ARAC|nr:hypothetical protein CDAR_13681 [Caerostris darwini]
MISADGSSTSRLLPPQEWYHFLRPTDPHRLSSVSYRVTVGSGLRSKRPELTGVECGTDDLVKEGRLERRQKLTGDNASLEFDDDNMIAHHRWEIYIQAEVKVFIRIVLNLPGRNPGVRNISTSVLSILITQSR